MGGFFCWDVCSFVLFRLFGGLFVLDLVICGYFRWVCVVLRIILVLLCFGSVFGFGAPRCFVGCCYS